MKRKFPVESKEPTDHDLFILRRFCADELKKYLPPIKDFWVHYASYSEREPGDHPLIGSEFASAVGYRIEKRKVTKGNLKGIAAYPFVRVRSLKVVPADGSAKHVLRKALDEPLLVDEFHCVLASDSRIAFLTEEAYARAITGRLLESCVVLGREEVYAMLAGSMLAKTRKKLMRVFDIEEGEWLE